MEKPYPLAGRWCSLLCRIVDVRFKQEISSDGWIRQQLHPLSPGGRVHLPLVVQYGHLVPSRAWKTAGGLASRLTRRWERVRSIRGREDGDREPICAPSLQSLPLAQLTQMLSQIKHCLINQRPRGAKTSGEVPFSQISETPGRASSGQPRSAMSANC